MPPGSLSLLRALVPTWKFFDVHHQHVSLWVRGGPSLREMGPFRPCLAPPPRSFAWPIFDPASTARLAERTVLEELLILAADAEPDALRNAAPFKMVRALARREAGSGHALVQFKIRVRVELSDRWEDALVAAPFSGER